MEQKYFYGFSSAEMAECATGPEEATQTGMQAPSVVTWRLVRTHSMNTQCLGEEDPSI